MISIWPSGSADPETGSNESAYSCQSPIRAVSSSISASLKPTSLSVTTTVFERPSVGRDSSFRS
ncbi:hypothetical protein ACFQH2_02105 [Natronoarchaeum sp. GCM10025703]|uniref:hypothetical protein n=1 Tax=Natronoarchaeum sp. GCM10025703 TaxID=3252685 RepID=UPI003613BBBA